MRPLWKGAISFGLVSIPVGLYSAIKSTRRVDLDMLRDSDQSRIHYKRVAEADGEEVPWEHIVKGFEYEQDQYVVLTKEDFERVQIKSSQMIEIREFVDLAEIDPEYFAEPYFLAPERAGAKAYGLLWEALKGSGRAGIAKVVIRPPREHLAALRPLENVLALQLMCFPDELRDPKELDIKTPSVARKELDMATALIKSMSGDWEPEKYHDEYREALMALIEQKIKAGGKAPPKQKAEKKGKVIDLMSVLQQSIREAGESKSKKGKRGKGRKAA